ncbi:hypothetical protein [Nocardia wallacei]|uniref:hypothetical protein n=1 Tax=Nocardia wallacei TaxID=480035 RepID=UPI00245606CA|nr:hypothetical protein [Nocardia wallacei]
MISSARPAVLVALIATAAASVVVACSSTDSTSAAPSSTKSAPPASATAFPEPPPYTHEVVGKEIRVTTSSADPTDLLNTYNKVARTLRPTLAEGGYWVRINCSTGSTDTYDHRLANGHIGIGKLGIAQTGDLGKFDGAVPSAHCP